MISGLSAKYCAAFVLHMELVPDHRLLEFAHYSHQFSSSSPSNSSLGKKRACHWVSYWHGDMLSSMIGIEMPALSGCIEDQELSSFKDDMLADVMELKVEKADDDVQYRTGCYETNACKWKQINPTIYLNFNL